MLRLGVFIFSICVSCFAYADLTVEEFNYEKSHSLDKYGEQQDAHAAIYPDIESIQTVIYDFEGENGDGGAWFYLLSLLDEAETYIGVTITQSQYDDFVAEAMGLRSQFVYHRDEALVIINNCDQKVDDLSTMATTVNNWLYYDAYVLEGVFLGDCSELWAESNSAISYYSSVSGDLSDMADLFDLFLPALLTVRSNIINAIYP